MIKKFINLVIGDQAQAREYKDQKEAINKLPSDFKITYKRIIKYYETVGGVNDTSEFMRLRQDLLNLFNEAVSNKQTVKETVGNDVASFANDFLNEYSSYLKQRRQQLNEDIKVGLEAL